jgi:hypothetical protein
MAAFAASHSNGFGSILSSAAPAPHPTPLIAPPPTPPPPVCTSNGGRDKSVSWHPFRFPVGIDYLRALPCAADPILGRDDAWLPVTHVGGPARGPTDSGGIWFYYAQGCSDLLWHMGRTVLVRNRAHAAVRIEQMAASLQEQSARDWRQAATAPTAAAAAAAAASSSSSSSSSFGSHGAGVGAENASMTITVLPDLAHGGSSNRNSGGSSHSGGGGGGDSSSRGGGGSSGRSGGAGPMRGGRTSAHAGGYAISEREAVRRIAAWLTLRYPRWAPLGRARGWAGFNATIEHVLAEAARGLYGHCAPPSFSPAGRLRPCRCASNSSKPTTVSRSRRLLALTPVCGDKVLSLHSEGMLRKLPVDTLVLHKQPQGGGNPSWTTEIWDLRGSPALSRHLENASAHPEVVGRARWWVGPGRLAAADTGTDATPRPPLGSSPSAGKIASASSSSPWLSACEPSDSWHTCFSCRGSQLEHGCNGTVAHYRAHGACHWQKMKRGKQGAVAPSPGAPC